jgi:hypothetical protein
MPGHPCQQLEIEGKVVRRSPLYTAPITLGRTTAVRASAFKGNWKLAVHDAIIFTKVNELETKKQKRQRRGK